MKKRVEEPEELSVRGASPPIAVYLAANYARKAELRALAKSLLPHRIHSTARWLDESDDQETDPRHMERGAVLDVGDILACQVFVVFHGRHEFNARGGKHAELGTAIAYEKPIILVGEREHVMHWHPLVWRTETAYRLPQKIQSVFRNREARAEAHHMLIRQTRSDRLNRLGDLAKAGWEPWR
jgi:hypothetical protein